MDCGSRIEYGVAAEPPGLLHGASPFWLLARLSRKTNPIPDRRSTQDSTMLSFHHSSPMPVVQNKPNCRKRGTKAMSGRVRWDADNRAEQSQLSPGRRLAGTANPRRIDYAKRSRTWAGWDIWGAAPARPIAPNKANFPHRPNGNKGLKGRELW